MVKLDEIEEVLEDGVGFVLGHADNTLGEVRVDEDRLPASYWIRPRVQTSQCKTIFYNMEHVPNLIMGWTASR